MGATLAGIVFGAAAVIAAFVLRPRYLPTDLAMRGAIFWIVATPILFIMPTALLALVVCGVALVPLTPKAKEDRAAFYILTLVAVPANLIAFVPFPGLNYLIALNFAKVSCFALLLPPLLFSSRSNAARYAPTPGLALFLLGSLYAIQEFRSDNLTSGLRDGIDDFLLYVVPFAAIVRLIPSRAQFDRIIATFGFVAAIFFFAAIVSEVMRWNFYTFIGQRFGMPALEAFADIRYGFLRIGVTLNTVLSGFVMALGLLATEYFRAQRMLGFAMAWAYRGAFALAAFFTFSRGAWLSIGLSLATFYFFTKGPRGLRAPAVTFAAFVILPVAIFYALNADFSSVDEYGTFEYRRELLSASMRQIGQHPLFGDAFYLTSGNFSHLVQGQGIVDVVNHYLEIALLHGLVGLGLYVGAFAAVIAGLLSLEKRIKETDDQKLELQRAVLMAATAGYLLLIATTSAVSLVSQFGVLILALSAAFIGAVRAEIKTGIAYEDAADEQGERS